MLSDDDDEEDLDLDGLRAYLREHFETVFPAKVITGIQVPRTYKEAIEDHKYVDS
jgi:hypothetical protein